MKVNNISSTNFGAGITINAAKNENCLYLYNQVRNLTNEFQIPANFRTKEIELPSASRTVRLRLKKLGIKFSSTKLNTHKGKNK